MKATLPLLCAPCGFAGAFAGYRLAAPTLDAGLSQGSFDTTKALEPGVELVESAKEPSQHLVALEHEVSLLKAQLMRMEERSGRARVEGREQLPPDPSAEAMAATEQASPEELARIQLVIEQERERRKQEKDQLKEERGRERKHQDFLEKAVNVASSRDLPPGSAEAIADVLSRQHQELQEIMERFGNRPSADELLLRKQEIDAVHERRDAQLNSLYGSDVARVFATKDQRKKLGYDTPADGPNARSRNSKKKSRKKNG